MQFEDVHVLYMLRQARMPFFTMYSYPMYKIEDGYRVIDRSDDAKTFQAEAESYHELLKEIASRVERNMIIPKTWMKKAKKASLMASVVLEFNKSMTPWVVELERAMRFLETYAPSKPETRH